MRTILILTILLLLNSLICNGQTGLFKSSFYEFKNEVDPSKNNQQFKTRVLTLNLDAIKNKSFMWRETDDKTDEDIFYKWNIKSKVDAKFDKNKNIVETIYAAQFELYGIEANDIVYLYVVDDLNDMSLNVGIYNPKAKTEFWFYELTKL